MNAARKREPAFRLPLSREDVMRYALAAYNRAAADAVAPVGYPTPSTWAEVPDFLDQVEDLFGLHCRTHAHSSTEFDFSQDANRLDLWLSLPSSRDQHYRDVDPADWAAMQAQNSLDARASGASTGVDAGAGRSPADKGHGCPALSPAVGPALTHSQSADITLNGDPLFCASEVQELPVGETLPHTLETREETL